MKLSRLLSAMHAILFLSLLPPLTARADSTDTEESDEYYSRIIRLRADDPEAHVAEIEEAGGIVLRRRADLALTLLPADGSVDPAAYCGVRRAPSPRSHRHMPRLKPSPAMDLALPLSGVDRIISGTGLQSPYTGKGVVAGFCDLGFDTNHLNFTDAEGNCRIARVVKYTESAGRREVFSTPDEIRAMRTDNADEYHATHVAGIMAGSYRLSGMEGITEGSAITGIASDAEIVATMSELTEVGLLAGVEDIIEYAQEVGKPAVINLSVGNYTGPHDGTSLFCQYLDLCAEDAIICISSGNEGCDTNHQYLPDASAETPLRLRIAGADWVNLTLYGQTDIYAADSTPFTLTMRVADSPKDTSDPIIYQTQPIDFSRTPFIVISSQQDAEDPDVVYDPEFARYFDGNIYISGGIDPENGRYFASVIYDCTTEEPFSDEKRWARYRLEFLAVPEEPVRLDAFADGIHSWLIATYGNTNRPGNELSVSDLATGHRTISVGMYCIRPEYPLLNGEMFPGEGDFPFLISEYSGYGTTPDGRRLPLTSAPGRPVVSSWSRPFVDAHGEDMCSYRIKRDGETYYWGPMSGTSMSSPFVAGTIATWLEAAPDLTWRDVQQLILATNYYPSLPDGADTAADPRYGMGHFDGYAALQGILDPADLPTGVDTDHASLRAFIVDGRLNIFNNRDTSATLSLFSAVGLQMGCLDLGNSPFTSIDLDEISSQYGNMPLIICVTTESSDPLILKVMI